MAQPSHIFIAFSFLMTFAQPSITDMFQARNIAHLTAEAAELMEKALYFH